MKYKKIAEKLIELVDSGLYNDIWYYIKDFSNYKLLFILQTLPEDNEPPPIYEIDNQSNFLIGTLDQIGFIDYIGIRHPIVFNTYHKEDNNNYIKPLEKYVGDVYNYHNFKVHSIIEVPVNFSKKVDELVWLFQINYPSFGTIIESFQGLLNSGHKESNPNTYFSYFFNIISATTHKDGTIDYNIIVEMDCDQIDPEIAFSGNYFNDLLVEKTKEAMNQKINLADKIRLSKSDIKDELYRIENEFFKKRFTKQLIQDYHKVVEFFSNQILLILRPKILKEANNKSFLKDKIRYKKLLHSIRKYDDFKIQNLKVLYDFFKLIFEVEYNADELILGTNSRPFIEANLKQLSEFQKYSSQRNTVAHTFNEIDQNIGMSRIYSFRWVIEFLDELYWELKQGK